VRAGKVRAIGASNYAPDRLAQALAISDAHGWARFTVIEPHYNLLKRDAYEGALQELVLGGGLGVVPYYGLASGYLTGKYRSEADLAGSPREKWIRADFEGKGPAVLAAMDAIAAETGADLAAIALAWLRAQPGISAPIASATNTRQIGSLMAGLEVRLSSEQVDRLTRAGQRLIASPCELLVACRIEGRSRWALWPDPLWLNPFARFLSAYGRDNKG
jgi:aryl-alcohol dehydrogenase-like predicted oxidoreductase